MLWPLGFTVLGFSLLFGSIVLMRMRAILAQTKVEARLQRLARGKGRRASLAFHHRRLRLDPCGPGSPVPVVLALHSPDGTPGRLLPAGTIRSKSGRERAGSD